MSPTGGCEFEVYCDMCLVSKGEGWIVIQRRNDGGVAFQDKNWDDYKTGFGDYLGEYWMGLQKIHEITRSGTYELHVGFKKGGQLPEAKYWAIYSSFSVSDEDDNYKLTVSDIDESRSWSSSVDSLKKHDGQPFTTYDKDNDGVDGVNCANHTNLQFGGWWFGGTSSHNSDLNNCIYSNLNGKYLTTGVDYVNNNFNGNGIRWRGINPFSASFVKTIMAIRRVN